MPTELKQSNSLSRRDKQLACLSDKPDPRPFFAKNLHMLNPLLTINAL